MESLNKNKESTIFLISFHICDFDLNRIRCLRTQLRFISGLHFFSWFFGGIRANLIQVYRISFETNLCVCFYSSFFFSIFFCYVRLGFFSVFFLSWCFIVLMIFDNHFYIFSHCCMPANGRHFPFKSFCCCTISHYF